MRTRISVAFFLFSYLSFFGSCYAENGVSLGYGFGAWNAQGPGCVEKKTPYDYATLSYLYEKPLKPGFALVAEPYLGLVNRPAEGVDIGVNFYAKASFPAFPSGGRLYVTAGTGAAYTSVDFREQGTHGLFILQAGIGYGSGRFFMENRFHHYSNGGLAKPNRSVNSNLIRIGWYF